MQLKSIVPPTGANGVKRFIPHFAFTCPMSDKLIFLSEIDPM